VWKVVCVAGPVAGRVRLATLADVWIDCVQAIWRRNHGFL
jgi:hypothetical protein